MTLPGPNRVNLPSGTNTAVPNSGLRDPRLHGHNQDQGPSSHYQHPVSARPVYYVQAPPPPPFLQYQWPMPISYNPFSGFPGMVSDSCLIFSTPAEKPPKEPGMQSEMSAAKKDQSMTPSEKLLLASPTCLQSEIILPSLTAEDVDENRSSEPEAYQSPNQEYLIVIEQRERSPCSHEQEATPLLSSVAVEETSSRDHPIGQNQVDIAVEDGTYGSEGRSRLRNETCFPVAEQNAEVSKTQCQQCSSKGHLVDCGVQCTELKELQELCMGDMEPNRGHPSKYSDVKKSKKGKDEGFSMNTQKNQRRHNQWRNGGSERYSSQQDAVNGYSGRPGKSKGGNVRNPRY
ncbi:Hypothetical protein SMAX5B_001294 [Scophthalmus maximus]|uniref:Uncharacterized protein n=1 Tax=Scophthalmus maximus TaxID=52904 RepID=A0A2U9BLN2_SCOMX|nr:Hypothetical protein SMAX5B_001294 [Scophthalmus maximus]